MPHQSMSDGSIVLHILGIGGLTTLAIGLGYALMWAIAALIEWINN